MKSRLFLTALLLSGFTFATSIAFADTSTDVTAINLASATAPSAMNLAAATSTSTKTSKDLPESQIPVLLPKAAQIQSTVNPWGRLFFSFFIIAVVGGGMMVFARWYSGKHKKNGDMSKIRILTQFHIGPKKSLAIVRVAGEAILIGITDHNISMLKSLSLLDGEMPMEMPSESGETLNERLSETPSNFKQTLAQTDSRNHSEPSAVNAPIDEEFALARIKDRVSLKVKDLRRL